MNDPNPLFTIGHSTHTADHFLALLRLHNIAQLVDVRTVPKSRRHPQFNGDALDNFLRGRASVIATFRHWADCENHDPTP